MSERIYKNIFLDPERVYEHMFPDPPNSFETYVPRYPKTFYKNIFPDPEWVPPVTCLPDRIVIKLFSNKRVRKYFIKTVFG
jgi:hypothetical protein